MKLRRYARVPVEYAASFSNASAHGEGVIVDISLGGCKARSSFMTQQDENLLGVLIHPPGKNPIYIMRAITRWTNANEFGMEFVDTEVHVRERLTEIIGKSTT